MARRPNSPRMEIEPFRSWCHAHIREHCEGSVRQFAERLQIDERVVRTWLYERKSIELDTADRAACMIGDHLADIYPHLYVAAA